MTDLIPQNDQEFVQLLSTLAHKLPNYAAQLGISLAELNSLQADALFMAAMVRANTSAQAYAKAWTAFRGRARNGGSGTMTTFPNPADVSMWPARVVPGIEKRTRLLARRIKSSINYNHSIGKDLGIVATQGAAAGDAPKLSVKLKDGYPNLRFSKGKAQGVRIFSKRGSETEFTFLAIDTRSPYVDIRPNLTEGVPERREYHAFYFEDDRIVGQQSPIVGVTL